MTSFAIGAVVPTWYMYAGLAALGVGMLILFSTLVPKKQQMTTEERVLHYTTKATGLTPAQVKAQEQTFTAAKQAAASMLARNRGLESRIATRLEGAGSELKASEWLLIHIAIFLGAGVLGLLISGGGPLITVLFMLLGAWLPWWWLGFRRNRRRKAFNAALPETLQLMSGSLAAGLSLAQSVDTIVREGVDPVASEFKRVLVENRLGVGLEESMAGVAERFESKDFEWVVMAINIQRQVGGNLAELLNTVAATMREREYIRRQVATLAAEGKLSAIVLGGLPPAFLLYLLLANHDYVMVLFTRPLGWLMLGGGALILGVGVFWMSRIVKVEV